MNIPELIPGLKSEIRTGWNIEGVPNPESVADHTWGMTLLLILAFDRAPALGEGMVDREKTLRMAIVHDLQEAVTGDLVVGRFPEGMTAEEKRRREERAEEKILAKEPIAGLSELWREYRACVTLEARLVKDIDRLELALQARHYVEADLLPEEAAHSFFGAPELYLTETGRSMYGEFDPARRSLSPVAEARDSNARNTNRTEQG